MQLAKLVTRIRPMELAEFLKKVLGIGYKEFQVGERSWYLDPASNFGSRMIEEGTYEQDVTGVLLSLLGPGDVFLDIGANEGWFSVRAAEVVGDAGRVIAVEPQARLWPVLLRNFQLNRIHNYQLVPYAVGQTEGFIEMTIYPSTNTGASSLVAQSRTRAMQRQKTGILPLRRIAGIHNVTDVRLAKIDVEGYELEVLKSAGDLLGTIEHIYVELHPHQLRALGQSVEDVTRLLESTGYQKRCISNVDLWTLKPAGAQ